MNKMQVVNLNVTKKLNIKMFVVLILVISQYLLSGCTPVAQFDNDNEQSLKSNIDVVKKPELDTIQLIDYLVYLDTIDFASKIFSMNSSSDGMYLTNKDGCVVKFDITNKEYSDTCIFSTLTEENILSYYETSSMQAITYGFDIDYISLIILASKDTLMNKGLRITDLINTKVLFNELEFIEPSAKAISLDMSLIKYDTLPFRGVSYFHPNLKDYFVIQYDMDGVGKLYLVKNNSAFEELLSFETPTYFVGYCEKLNETYLYSNSQIFKLNAEKNQVEIFSGNIKSAIYNKQDHSIFGIEFDEGIEKYKIFNIKLSL